MTAVSVPGEMSCSEIEPFVDLLQYTGHTYDYGASQNPADLMSRTDIVIRGRLVGANHVPPLIVDEEIRHGDRIGFTVDLGEVLYDEDPALSGFPAPTLDHNPTVRNAEDYIDLLPTGVEVIVLTGAEGSVLLEGFWIECDVAAGTRLVGLTSSGRDWPELHTLDELEAALALG